MSITPRNLYCGALSDSLAALITASTTKFGITSIEAFNTSGTTETVTLAINKDAGDDIIIYEESVETKKRFWPEYGGVGLVLEPGMILKAMADTADVVNVVISGTEIGALIESGGGGGDVPFASVYSTYFDGSSEYVYFYDGGYLSFEKTNPFSFSAWVKPNNYTSSYQGIFVKRFWPDGAGDAGYFLGFQTGTRKLLMDLKDASANQINSYSNTSVTHSVWSHVCCTYDGSNHVDGMKMYINGAEDTPYTKSGTSVPGTIITAGPARVPNITPSYQGYLCQVSAWNKALSSGEISQIYNSGAPADLRLLSFYETDCLGWHTYGNMGDKWPVILNQVTGGQPGVMVNMVAGDFVADVPA